MRYECRVKAPATKADGWVSPAASSRCAGATAVTLLVAAATNFVSHDDVSGDPAGRVAAVLGPAAGKPYDALRQDARAEHRRLFRRTSLRSSGRPTTTRCPPPARLEARRRARTTRTGRALLPVRSIPPDLEFPAAARSPPTSRASGTRDSNPVGQQVHDEHQRRDELLAGRGGEPAECVRAAGPDGEASWPDRAHEWRGCTTAPAAGCFTRTPTCGARRADGRSDLGHLARPAAPGSARTCGSTTASAATGTSCATSTRCSRAPPQFFLDTLVEHPSAGWLVTCPSNSPENFPARARQRALLRRSDRLRPPGTTIVAGPTMDMQILRELFADSWRRPRRSAWTRDLRDRARDARRRLAPMHIGLGATCRNGSRIGTISSRNTATCRTCGDSSRAGD